MRSLYKTLVRTWKVKVHEAPNVFAQLTAKYDAFGGTTTALVVALVVAGSSVRS